MSEEVKKIPKFRTTSRLLQWIRKNYQTIRLPKEIEEVFFTSKKETADLIASNLAAYAHFVGKFDSALENLLKPNHVSIVSYFKIISRGDSKDLNEELLDELKGDNENLLSWSRFSEQRLPKHLEDSLSDPKACFLYAKDVIRGRLPDHLEDVFFKNPYWASRYAFEIIRGFASVKLPEKLHAFMIMKSFEDPEDESIKKYMEASESDPSKSGNSKVKVT